MFVRHFDSSELLVLHEGLAALQSPAIVHHGRSNATPAGSRLKRTNTNRIRRKGSHCWSIPVIPLLVFATALCAHGATPSLDKTLLDINASRVPKFALFEATFRLDEFDPHEPNQIDVYAQIREPGGTVTRVAAFHAQDFRLVRKNNEEQLEPVGTPAWHVRFTPRKVGRHRMTLCMNSGGLISTGETVEFECVDSNRPGFVRAAKNAQNFECDDGSSFFAIGLNTCWGKDCSDYERWLVRMAENGINTGRLWIGPMFLFDPEPKDGLGKYDQRAAWRLDYVLQLAERHNIRLMFCLESFNSLRIKPEYAEWQNNPYNAANGGPCAKPEEFFTDATARDLFKRRLRYLVARYSYSPNVLAWEFWNEVDLVETYVPAEIKTWHAEMADYITSLDPNKHLMSTSFSKPEGEPEIDSLPQFGFVQTHSYTALDLATDFSAYAAKQKTFAHPHLLGEFGLHWEGKGNAADPEGLHLRETIWSTALSGSAGCGMSWWWDSYIDPQNLWPIYRPLAAFSADIRWNRCVWQPLQSDISLNADAPGIPVDHFLKGIPPEWKAHASNTPQRIEITSNGTLSGHATLAGILHGKGHHPELHNPPTFVIDSPQQWRFNVVVKGVSGYGGANLEIRIDESSALKEDFRDTDAFKDDTIVAYNKTYSVEVPAGRHTVFVQNTGTDWVTCEYELRGAGVTRTPPLKAFGQQTRDLAVAWIQNSTASQLARTRSIAPRTVAGATLKFDGLKDGPYSLEIWNTQNASYETRNVRVKDGTIQVDLPPIPSDLALKLRRK